MAERKTFPLRIDARMFDLVRKWAGDEMRSVNGQIEFLLRDSLKRSDRWKDAAEEPRPDAEETG